MVDVLIVVDMQNDFINGSLGTKEAEKILPYVINLVKTFKGKVFFTRDTHTKEYLTTQEGVNLPVPHCIKGEKGWQIHSELDVLRQTEPINKNTFGSKDLIKKLSKEQIKTITLVGLCTDICVISNALLIKAFYPEIEIIVDAKGCAGVTVQSHTNALNAMKMCQIKVINE